MATQAGASAQSTSVWVWVPAVSETPHFRHPADFPEDAAAVKSFFVGGTKGTKIARISPVTKLPSTGKMALIAEKGATREVATNFLLPWFEGCLLLDELESSRGQAGHLGATWFNDELQGILDLERKKHRNGQLSSAVYVERRLTTVAVTGPVFHDSKDVEYHYRREGLGGDEPPPDKGEIVEGYQQIQGILNYLPPWEALCHEKCGFYQDFYQVRWAHPFSEIDYSAVENGCTGPKGATWEPDECLPAHMDAMRVVAKRNWCKARREREAKGVEQRQKNLLSQASTKRVGGDTDAPTGKRLRADVEEVAKPTARTKRDGTALNRDMLRLASGHDLQEPSEKELGGIRNGWPKHPQDYPKGYSCASPPGFCRETCDCMDDQRPQLQWETSKKWLEDAMRTNQAKGGIEQFTAQTHFVMRRGLVSKMRHYFETAITAQGETNHMIAAQDLAVAVQRSMKDVLRVIPLSSIPLASSTDRARVCIPANAFLADDFDYSPVRCDVLSSDGSAAPEWLQVDPTSGETTVSNSVSLPENLHLALHLSHAEGRIATASVGVTPSEEQLWASVTETIMHRFNDMNRCLLGSGARAVLRERFADLYDFDARSPRSIELGEWLRVMSSILRMLRSAAVANLTQAAPARATAAPGARAQAQQGRMGAVPRTPPQ